MVEDDRNLLICLYRLANRQDENFLTECLAHLLRHLKELEPQSALSLLQQLSGDRLELRPGDLPSVSISTQWSTSYGVPDIRIRSQDHLMFVEVKVGSRFRNGQLGNYRQELEDSRMPRTTLAVLTRYPFTPSPNDAVPDVELRWHELADRCEGLQRQTLVGTSAFLVKQFVDFLKWRGVTVEPVGWELPAGIRSLQSLLVMVAEGIAANGIMDYTKSGAWDWHGYYFEGGKFFAGVYFEEPPILVVETAAPVKMSEGQRIELGGLIGGRWRRELDLSSEEVHFYARRTSGQLQCIEEFIRGSLSYGRTLVQ